MDSVSLLNKLCQKKRLEFQFMKLPVGSTQAKLFFNGKYFFGVERTVKDSRAAAAKKALDFYQSGIFYEDSGFTEKYVYPDELEEKSYVNLLSEYLKIVDLTPVYTFKQNFSELPDFECTVTVGDIVKTASSKGKAKSKEDASRIMHTFLKDQDFLMKKLNKEDLKIISCEEMNADYFKVKEHLSVCGEQVQEDHSPRDYQSRIAQSAIESNKIIVLGTGLGKTFIAVMVIRHFASQCVGEYPESAKRIIFVVPTVILMIQQKEIISRQTHLNVKGVCGADGADTFTPAKWMNILKEYHIIVLTAEIFRQMLMHRIIKWENIALVVFDECHHAISRYTPYGQILNDYYLPAMVYGCEAANTRLLGLTATPLINVKSRGLNRDDDEDYLAGIIKLENLLQGQCISAQFNDDEITLLCLRPTYETITFNSNAIGSYKDSSSLDKLDNMIKVMSEFDFHTIFNNEKVSLVTRDVGSEDFSLLCDELKDLNLEAPVDVYDDIFYLRSSDFLDGGPNFEKLSEALRNILVTCRMELIDNGIYAIPSMIKMQLSSVCNMLRSHEWAPFTNMLRWFYNNYLELFDLITEKCKVWVSDDSPIDLDVLVDEGLITRKFRSLMMVLIKHYGLLSENCDTESAGRISGIVFVKRRVTSVNLAAVINTFTKKVFKIAGSCGDPVFIKFTASATFLVGVSEKSSLKNMSSGCVSISRDDLRFRLQAFRSGYYNLMFGTDVIEEGIDIKQCNVCVRYDKIASYKSFVQSRGRARLQPSYFYAFFPNTEREKCMADLNQYVYLEKMIDLSLLKNTRNHTNFKLEQENLKLDDEDKIFKTSQSSIHVKAATPYLHKVIGSLTRQDSKTSLRFFYLQKGAFVQVDCVLPFSLNIYERVTGIWHDDIEIAKSVACLRAIKLLHEYGYIDDRFLPTVPKKASCLPDLRPDFSKGANQPSLMMKPDEFLDKEDLMLYYQGDLLMRIYFSLNLFVRNGVIESLLKTNVNLLSKLLIKEKVDRLCFHVRNIEPFSNGIANTDYHLTVFKIWIAKDTHRFKEIFNFFHERNGFRILHNVDELKASTEDECKNTKLDKLTLMALSESFGYNFHSHKSCLINLSEGPNDLEKSSNDGYMPIIGSLLVRWCAYELIKMIPSIEHGILNIFFEDNFYSKIFFEMELGALITVPSQKEWEKIHRCHLLTAESANKDFVLKNIYFGIGVIKRKPVKDNGETLICSVLDVVTFPTIAVQLFYSVIAAIFVMECFDFMGTFERFFHIVRGVVDRLKNINELDPLKYYEKEFNGLLKENLYVDKKNKTVCTLKDADGKLYVGRSDVEVKARNAAYYLFITSRNR